MILKETKKKEKKAKWIGEMTLGGDPNNPFPLKKKYHGYSQKIRKTLDKFTFDYVSRSPRVASTLEHELERYSYRQDTGWNCCVCGEVARVLGDGFTWCLKHWDKFDLGRKSDSKGFCTVARMRDEIKL